MEQCNSANHGSVQGGNVTVRVTGWSKGAVLQFESRVGPRGPCYSSSHGLVQGGQCYSSNHGLVQGGQCHSPTEREQCYSPGHKSVQGGSVTVRVTG